MANNLAPVGEDIIRGVGVPVVNTMTIPDFEGAAADAVRRRGRELVSRVDLLANNVALLGEYGNHLDRVLDTYTSTPDLLKKLDNMDELWYHSGSGWLAGTAAGTTVSEIEKSQGEITGIVTDKGVWGKDRLASATTEIVPGLVDHYGDIYYQAGDQAVGEGVDPTNEQIRALPTEDAIRAGNAGDISMSMSAFNADGVTGSFQDRDFLPGASALDKALAEHSKDMASHLAGVDTKAGSGGTSATTPTTAGAAGSGSGSGSGAGGYGGGGGGFGGGSAPMGRAGTGTGTGGNPLTRVGAPGFDEVSSDDIFDKLKEAGIGTDTAGSGGGAGSGAGSRYEPGQGYTPGEYTSYSPDPYKPGEYSPGSGSGSGAGYTPGSYTPNYSTYTPSTQLSGYTPTQLAGGGYTPGSTAYTPYSGSGAGSYGASGTSGTPMSNSALRDMVNRLTAPVGGGGSFGGGGGSFGSGAGSYGAGAGGTGGAGGLRPVNASTMGTGESGSRSTANTMPSGAAKAAGAAGSGGAGMRGGMPMGGMGGMGGGPGAGGGGGKRDKENAKIKNADGDLYGSDVTAVTPVISVDRATPVPESTDDAKKEDNR